jgi:hypothetical protein
MGLSLPDFVAKGSASGAAARANKDAFLIELCDVVDVPRPAPATGGPVPDGMHQAIGRDHQFRPHCLRSSG